MLSVVIMLWQMFAEHGGKRISESSKYLMKL